MILRLYLLIIIGLPLTSYAQQFSGQVFKVAEKFDEANCHVTSECDCCSSDLIFLDSQRFALISRCVFNDAYFGGTYHVEDSTLKLTFKQATVIEEVDEDTRKTKNVRKSTSIAPITFRISNCMDNRIRLRVEGSEASDFKNGSRVPDDDGKRIMQDLNATAAWKILQNGR